MTKSDTNPAAYLALSEQLRRFSGLGLAVDILSGALRQLNRREEEVGGDPLDALCSMIPSGRVDCSTATPDRTREFTDRDGNQRKATEIVLQRFRGELAILEAKSSERPSTGSVEPLR